MVDLASGLCVLHCLTVSFAPSVIENSTFASSYNEVFEWGFFGMAILFAIISAAFGLKKHQIHGVDWIVTGMAVLILGRLGRSYVVI